MKYLNGGLIILTNDFEGGLVKYIKDFDFDNPNTIIEGKSPTNTIVSLNPFLMLDKDKLMVNVSFHDTIYIIDMINGIITSEYIVGEKETSLRSVEAKKLVNDVMSRNGKAFKDLYIPCGLPMKLDSFIIIPMMSDKVSVMFSLSSNETYKGNLINTKGLFESIVYSHYPMMINDVLGGAEIDHYALLSANKLSEIDVSKMDQTNKYLPDIKRLKQTNTQNPILVKFEYKD